MTAAFDWSRISDAELAESARMHSATEIGRILGVSRNAVIGRCARRGISLTGGVNGRHHLTPEECVARAERRRVGERQKYTGKRVKLAASEPVAIFTDHLRLTLMQLRPDSCRWPLWTRETPFSEKRYCGVKAPIGQTYCSHCRTLSYQPPARAA